nr:GUN4 domain-containing protein [Cylindrospermopsis raciborskii]
MGGTKEYNRDVLRSMGERVGWRREGNWLYYSDLNFSQQAPSGHLPCFCFMGIYRWYGYGRYFPPVQTCRV